MRDTIKIFKLFCSLDLEKEEEWLRKMANTGLHFYKVNSLGMYTFKKGPCKDVIYKIDFNRDIDDVEEYYDLFRESGWSFIYKNKFINYFRYNGEADNYYKEIDIYNDQQLKWFYKENNLKKFIFKSGPIIATILITIMVSITITFVYTIGASYKSIENAILKYAKNNLYKMNSVDSIILSDKEDSRVCLYGNSEGIGVMNLDKSYFNRYIIKGNFSHRLPNSNCICVSEVKLKKQRYSILYGMNKLEDVDKIIIIYDDETKCEIFNKDLIRKSNYFMAISEAVGNIKGVKVYSKDNIDITNKYIKYYR